MTTEERVHALANSIGAAYTDELIPSELAHDWISELTLILAELRFAARDAEALQKDRDTQYAHAQGYY